MNYDFEKIFSEHKNLIDNLDKNTGNLLVLFSGIPLSGKTTIAKAIEEKYNFVRLNNDDVRAIIKKFSISIEDSIDQIQEILKIYTKELHSKNNFTGNSIIIDGSIDRDYDLWLNLAVKQKRKTFILRLDISKKTFIKRLTKREKSKSKNWITHYERWQNDFNSCKKEVKADIEIDANKNINLKQIFQAIDKLIK